MIGQLWPAGAGSAPNPKMVLDVDFSKTDDLSIFEDSPTHAGSMARIAHNPAGYIHVTSAADTDIRPKGISLTNCIAVMKMRVAGSSGNAANIVQGYRATTSAQNQVQLHSVRGASYAHYLYKIISNAGSIIQNPGNTATGPWGGDFWSVLVLLGNIAIFNYFDQDPLAASGSVTHRFGAVQSQGVLTDTAIAGGTPGHPVLGFHGSASTLLDCRVYSWKILSLDS